MSRGDRREAIFANDVDRQRLLETLTEARQKTGRQARAYCLKCNRFHWVMETPQPNLPAGMEWRRGRIGEPSHALDPHRGAVEHGQPWAVGLVVAATRKRLAHCTQRPMPLGNMTIS